jgi:2-oxo-4-hydroxy-4-carboxy-5-ureidoimidazoline decarboxylase
MAVKLRELNVCPTPEFVAICGPCYEHSPWVAERTAAQRPFSSRDALHSGLSLTVDSACCDEQLALIRAHPDLVGRAVKSGMVTAASAREQAIGLSGLTSEEVHRFAELNAAYWSRFGFPFVICVRENKKDAILAAFPTRLANSRAQEMRTALEEIAKIAKRRLFDAVEEG